MAWSSSCTDVRSPTRTAGWRIPTPPRPWPGWRQQNEVTEAYLAGAAGPGLVRSRPCRRSSAGRGPACRSAGGRYFVTRNDGTQNQDVWSTSPRLWPSCSTGGRVLVDPNTFSADGTSSLTTFTVASTGGLAAYGLSDAGSDWTDVPPDRPGHRRARSPTPEIRPSSPRRSGCRTAGRTSTPTSSGRAGPTGPRPPRWPGPALRLHRIGEEQEQDELVVRFPDNDAADGVRRGHRRRPLRRGHPGRGDREPQPALGLPDRPGPTAAAGSGSRSRSSTSRWPSSRWYGPPGRVLYLQTDLDAERGRLVRVDLDEFGRLRARRAFARWSGSRSTP